MSFVSDTVISTIGKVIDRVLPDQQARDAANLAIMQLNQTGELAQLTADSNLAQGQIATNTAEASNASLFVSGWRPFIGWVCGAGLAYQFVVLTLLLGMLGLGGLRTVEKINKVAS